MAEILSPTPMRAGNNHFHMEIMPYPTDHEPSGSPTSHKRPRSGNDDAGPDEYDSYTEEEDDSDADPNSRKRRRIRYELDMPVTNPGSGLPLHDPELYEEIQRMAKAAGAYMDAGANVVVKYHPYEPRTPTPPASFMRPWSYDGFFKYQAGGGNDDVVVVEDEDEDDDDDDDDDDDEDEDADYEEDSPVRPPVSPLTPENELRTQVDSSDDESAKRGVEALLAGIQVVDRRRGERRKSQEESARQQETVIREESVTSEETVIRHETTIIQQETVIQQEIVRKETPKQSGQDETPPRPITAGQTGGKKLPELMAYHAEMEAQMSPPPPSSELDRSSSGKAMDLQTPQVDADMGLPDYSTPSSIALPEVPPQTIPQPLEGLQAPMNEAAGQGGSTAPTGGRRFRGINAGDSGEDYSDYYCGREDSPRRPSSPPRLSPTRGMTRIDHEAFERAFPRNESFRRIRTWAGRQNKGPSIKRRLPPEPMSKHPCLTRPARRNIVLPPRPPIGSEITDTGVQPFQPSAPQEQRRDYINPFAETPLPSIERVPEDQRLPVQEPAAAPTDHPVARGGTQRRARIRIGPPRGRGKRLGAVAATEARSTTGSITETTTTGHPETPRPAPGASQPSQIATSVTQTLAPITPAAPAQGLNETAAEAPAQTPHPVARGGTQRRARIRIGPPRGRGNRLRAVASTEARSTTGSITETTTTDPSYHADTPRPATGITQIATSDTQTFAPTTPAAPGRRADARPDPQPERVRPSDLEPIPEDASMATAAPPATADAESEEAVPKAEMLSSQEPEDEQEAQNPEEPSQPANVANTGARRVIASQTIEPEPTQSQAQEPPAAAAPPKKGRGRAKAAAAPAPAPSTRTTRATTRAAAAAAAAAEAAANLPTETAQPPQAAQASGTAPKAAAAKTATKKGKAATTTAAATKTKAKAKAPAAKSTAKGGRGAKAKAAAAKEETDDEEEEDEDEDESEEDSEDESEEEEAKPPPKATASRAKKGAKPAAKKAPAKKAAAKGSGRVSKPAPKKGGKKK